MISHSDLFLIRLNKNFLSQKVISEKIMSGLRESGTRNTFSEMQRFIMVSEHPACINPTV